MSSQITTSFVKQFGSTVQLLSQQRGSMLRMAVRNETIHAEEAFYDQIGATTAIKKTARHSDTPLIDTPFSRRRVAPEDYEWADLIDKEDRLRQLIDPQSPMVQSAAYAFGRAVDDALIAAADGTAYTGKTGATSTAYDTDNDVAVSVGGSNTGLNLAKLIEAKHILDKNEVDPSIPRYVVANSKQMSNLLGVTEVKSADYNTVKALVQGEINTFLGFNFIRTERIGVDGSSNDKVLFFARDGLLLATAAEMRARISERDDKSYATQVYVSMTFGATRMEEAKVGRILCYPS